ncbi:MAG: TonB-dependent receptor plug domain-containing protein, partial [Paludibacteraceae bacterium]|nr:TonB-dependent receptor plug domain-containing protein [Paludibacteraceae bacterium]
GTIETIDAATTRVMPDATGGSIESLLITFAGVNQNNELSSQYNVRGGSFDENQVYVNGIEIHRPLLIRSGQQEGLSFVNPEMVENVQFSAGGFNACYGDKMSSMLDITYKRPTKLESSVSLSLLGANLYVGHGNERYSQMHGLRYKTSAYMLGALKTAGNYQPNYFDYQTYITWKAKDWTMSLLANYSQNDYRFVPDSLTESFGGTENAKNMSIWYEGQEKDLFRTAFASLSAKGHVSKEVELGFDLSGYYTNEQENFDITGEYVLSGDTGAIATGLYHEHARNRLQAGIVTLAHHGRWSHQDNDLHWGVSAQAELISDVISEWRMRDSAQYSLPNIEKELPLFYSLKGTSAMQSARVQAYIENTHSWQTDKGKVIFNVGARLNYWSFTNEVLPSPRANVTFIPGWKRDFSFRFATGLYYQAPFYKELRDTATVDGVTRITLNDKLKAQRSVHVIFGSDYYFRAWGRPFKFAAEAYYKHIDRMETYTVDNVRVRYSGQNDAHGFAAGVDLKLYGELVPGADSWINFSAGAARQKLNERPELGWIPSPNEQRWSFSMLFQDYIPQLPQLVFHFKTVFADGQPFAAPNDIVSQKSFRTAPYKRIDLGATYVFNRKTAKFMRNPKADHIKQWAIQFEVFNIVGWNNVNSYFWVSDAEGQLWASPNYLTGRRFNLKFTIDIR